ncbi:hypothetical protein QF030_001248 [Streptomyces rishiriensis]|uniref:Uncharacterized protein n=1 Tax=Streptomyces rishiriensis TaxID=68264 RepID=A0ABU0NKM8_STRRH|nr:hypothetical protein [Streptomyces rishiriensis]
MPRYQLRLVRVRKVSHWVLPSAAARPIRDRPSRMCAKSFSSRASPSALARPVEAESGQGLGGALDDAGALLGAEGVAVAPDPAVLGLHEGEGEGVEDLGGAEPDVGVAPRREFGAEVVGVVRAQGTVDTVAGDDQIGVREVLCGDPALVLQPYAERAGPGGEDLQQLVPADAVPLVARLTGRQVPYVGDALVPADGLLLDRVRRLGVADAESVEEALPVRDTPAVGRALRVALVDGDVVGRILPLEQDREIQAGGPAADTGDLHAHSQELPVVVD